MGGVNLPTRLSGETFYDSVSQKLTIAKLKTVKGVGEKTVEKFGKQLINSIQADEKSE